MDIRREEKIVYHNSWLRVTEELYGTTNYVRAYSDATVHVLPITEDNKVILIHEKRHGESQSRWLLVSGGVDDKTPLEAAQAELAEEAGLEGEHWEIYMEKAYSGKAMNEHRYYFLAKGLKEVDVENPDGDVIIETKSFSKEEIKKLIFEGFFDWSPAVFPLLKWISDQENN